MSRTDKDRPWWVMVLQDGNHIDHDHRRGECIVETAQQSRTGWRGTYRGSHKNCKKSYTIEFSCFWRTVDGRRQRVYDIDDPGRAWIYDIGRQTCWTKTCDHPHSRMVWSVDFYYCEEKYDVECVGHRIRRYDASIPCVCDEWPPRPTCTIEADDSTRHRWCAGGVPSWYVSQVYHRPERARERSLRDFAREYNTYGEIEDDDFENRQGRNSARWSWW